MSNVYKHRNCLKLNLWNCNWDNQLPELDGHVTVIFNIITTQFRVWLRPKCTNGVWTELTEITSYSEKTRQYIIKGVYRRLKENCGEINPTGARDIETVMASFKEDSELYNIYANDLGFIRSHYVGDYLAAVAELPNQFALRYTTNSPYFPPFERRPDFETISGP